MNDMDKFNSDMAAINAHVDRLLRENAELREALEYVVNAHKFAHDKKWQAARLREIGEHAYESDFAAIRLDSLKRAEALLAKVAV